MSYRTGLSVVLLILLLGCRSAPELKKQSIAPQDWVVDPSVPGPDQPPAGRSLFDEIAPSPLPFPFEKLLDAISTRAGGAQPRRVLIPLGRSLQRSAGAPQFFRYPRAVAAFDTNGGGGALVKDRLYLGYHEKAGVIEVISYNEDAGRFEFQLIENYRADATPHIAQAPRNVCTACHQNHGPLFPVQLWDETNSNYRVSAMLAAQGREFYGFPIQTSADVPYQIDLAVHRANELSAYQLLWQSVDTRTRTVALQAALRCRLSGNCRAPELEQPLAKLWQAKWANGLSIPNPEIPNRNPLAILSREGPADAEGASVFLAARQKNIEPHFEPAAPRLPLDVWQARPETADRWIAGLAAFFSDSDVSTIETWLAAVPAAPAEYHATCRAIENSTRRVIRCEPVGAAGFTLDVRGSVAALSTIAGQVVRDLEIVASNGTKLKLRQRNSHPARCSNGDRIESIEFQGVEAILKIRQDFAAIVSLVERLRAQGELDGKPFRRTIVLNTLRQEKL